MNKTGLALSTGLSVILFSNPLHAGLSDLLGDVFKGATTPEAPATTQTDTARPSDAEMVAGASDGLRTGPVLAVQAVRNHDAVSAMEVVAVAPDRTVGSGEQSNTDRLD